ncbi:hypothetical protein [Maritalea mediterranea]|uniref:Replication protein n=1 Tax=Maritalea mediterranea TaxID=2909667 RepID=A0ABS9EA62_9HYPH|nr:hypothetical protein [Maritalea mediterranea]MCF4099776.1 hypothetical protein [Maritalea mediterranea]
MTFAQVKIPMRLQDGIDGFGNQLTPLSYTKITPEQNGLDRNLNAGKFIVKPEIDFKDYRRTTVIDFVDIVIAPQKGSVNYKSIRKKLKDLLQISPHVIELPRSSSGQRYFRVRIQDLKRKRYDQLNELFQTNLPLNEPPRLGTLELSIDFRPKKVSDQSFVKMHSVLARHFVPYGKHLTGSDERMRIYVPEGLHCEQLARLNRGQEDPSNTLKLQQTQQNIKDGYAQPYAEEIIPFGSTVYYGREDPDYYAWRIMHKRLDNQNWRGDETEREKKEKELAINKQRTRIEVTVGELGLKELGLTHFHSLKGFNFQTAFSKLFKFQVPMFDEITPGPRERLRKLLQMNTSVRRYMHQGVFRLTHYPAEVDLRSRSFPRHVPKLKPACVETVSYRELDRAIAISLRSIKKAFK